jgi:hypothetical protein
MRTKIVPSTLFYKGVQYTVAIRCPCGFHFSVEDTDDCDICGPFPLELRRMRDFINRLGK